MGGEGWCCVIHIFLAKRCPTALSCFVMEQPRRQVVRIDECIEALDTLLTDHKREAADRVADGLLQIDSGITALQRKAVYDVLVHHVLSLIEKKHYTLGVLDAMKLLTERLSELTPAQRVQLHFLCIRAGMLYFDEEHAKEAKRAVEDALWDGQTTRYERLVAHMLGRQVNDLGKEQKLEMLYEAQAVLEDEYSTERERHIARVIACSATDTRTELLLHLPDVLQSGDEFSMSAALHSAYALLPHKDCRVWISQGMEGMDMDAFRTEVLLLLIHVNTRILLAHHKKYDIEVDIASDAVCDEIEQAQEELKGKQVSASRMMGVRLMLGNMYAVQRDFQRAKLFLKYALESAEYFEDSALSTAILANLQKIEDAEGPEEELV